MWKLLSLFCLLLASASPQTPQASQRRLAIDIGSSGVKVRIAEIGRQPRTVYQNIVRIPIREEIETSGTRELSNKITRQISDVVAESVRLARSLGATEVASVATVGVKNAKNADALMQEIKKASGVETTFIDQDEEAVIGFEGAASVTPQNRFNLVVWDIGGERAEITTLDRNREYVRFATDVASATFANLVLSKIKHENPEVVTTPNPLTKEQIDEVVALAVEKTQGVPAPIRQKIRAFNTSVIGIGAIPFLALNRLGPTHTVEEIRASLYAKADLKDSQLPGPYPNHVVTNLALVLGTMEGLAIRQVTFEVVDLTSGLVLLPQYLQPMPMVEDKDQAAKQANARKHEKRQRDPDRRYKAAKDT